jgi:hypothetical protein
MVTPYKQFFNTARTMLISNIVAGIYTVTLLFAIFKIRKIYKMVLFPLFILFLLLGILKLADPNAVKSIINLKELKRRFEKENAIILTKKDNFKIKNFGAVKIYQANPKNIFPLKIKTVFPQQKKPKPIKLESNLFSLNQKTSQRTQPPQLPQQISLPQQPPTGQLKPESQPNEINARSMLEEQKVQFPEKPSIPHQTQPPQLPQQISLPQQQVKLPLTLDQTQKKSSFRNLNVAYNNSLFRILIWRDMFKEVFFSGNLIKWIFGVDFGKPLRSISIEILFWADGDWTRDGWIAVHNSYLDIIYRAGIIGIILILTIFYYLFKIIKRSLKIRSIIGILLSGILINWFIAANFLEILTLPYNAIPFWSLFGMTYAYLNRKDSFVLQNPQSRNE